MDDYFISEALEDATRLTTNAPYEVSCSFMSDQRLEACRRRTARTIQKCEGDSYDYSMLLAVTKERLIRDLGIQRDTDPD